LHQQTNSKFPAFANASTLAAIKSTTLLMAEKSEKEIEQLIQYSVGFADETLTKHGEFYPFAAYIGPIGELVPIGIQSEKEYPDSNDLIGEFETLFEERKTKGEIVAYAIAIDVRITNSQFPQSTDTIAIKTYHMQRQQQITYYFPYQKQGETVQILEGWGETA
jgi:hypothetical protein